MFTLRAFDDIQRQDDFVERRQTRFLLLDRHPRGIEQKRARALWVTAFVMPFFFFFSIGQYFAFMHLAGPAIVDPVIGLISVALNGLAFLVVSLFFILNFLLAPRRPQWDPTKTYVRSVHLLFLFFWFFALTHIHLAGSSVTLLTLVLLILAVLVSFLIGYREAWIYYFTGCMGVGLLYVLEILGILPFLPLHAQHSSIPHNIFLEPRYLGINFTLFLINGSFLLAVIIHFQKLLDRRAEMFALRHRQLEQSYEQLRQLEQMRDDLTHMIVHDLRSPLAGIKLDLQVLQRRLTGDPRAARNLDRAMKAMRLVLKDIDSLLDVNRIEQGAMHLNRQPIDLHRCWNQVFESLCALQEQCHVHAVFGPNGVQAHADPDLIQRVIANLLANALKYTPNDGVVEAGAETTPEGGVRFWLRDTGPGIPAAYHEKIFEKFGQVEIRGNGRLSSTGLGLAFCKLAVEAHGGRIGVESQVGEGSTFWFTLPHTKTPDDRLTGEES